MKLSGITRKKSSALIAQEKPVSSRLAVIIAARKRGWSTGKIALALNVSATAVSFILRRYAPDCCNVRHLGKKGNANTRARQSRRCIVCGKVIWFPFTSESDRQTKYCSKKCSHEPTRALNDDDISRAITMRMNGQTWTGIARVFGHPIQVIQLNIWTYLAKNHLLSDEIVTDIWKPRPQLWQTNYATKWLERRTGMVATPEGGARIGKWESSPKKDKKINKPKSSAPVIAQPAPMCMSRHD